MGTDLDALRDELASARSEITDLRAEVKSLRSWQIPAAHPWMAGLNTCVGAAPVPQTLVFNTAAPQAVVSDMTFGGTYGAAGCAMLPPVITWNVPA